MDGGEVAGSLLIMNKYFLKSQNLSLEEIIRKKLYVARMLHVCCTCVAHVLHVYCTCIARVLHVTFAVSHGFGHLTDCPDFKTCDKSKHCQVERVTGIQMLTSNDEPDPPEAVSIIRWLPPDPPETV